MANYSRELRIGVDIRRKGKVEKATEFAERIKKGVRKSQVSIKKDIERDKIKSI